MSGAPTTLAGTQVIGGVGGTTFGTLSSIGSDLSVSVSFNIAHELLDAAHDEQLAADELISLVLGFAIILHRGAVAAQQGAGRSRAVGHRGRAEARAGRGRLRQGKLGPEIGSLFDEGFMQAAEQAAVNELATKRSGLDFLALVVNILQRILVAISVQLLAASVRAQQQSRLVRTVSLIGLAIFFVFVESLTNRHV